MQANFNRPEQKAVRKKLRNNATEAELYLWKHLRKSQLHGYKFWRQYGVSHYILDFYCPKLRLAIELDGGHHAEAINAKQDEERTKFLEALNIKVVRFWNNDVLNNINGVLAEMEKVIVNISPPDE